MVGNKLNWLYPERQCCRPTKEEQALGRCRPFPERNVSGVFFAPLELTPDKDQTNLAIVAALDKAHVQVVLVDRCIFPFPRRSRYDRRAGYLATEHHLKQGRCRILFTAELSVTSTVKARFDGFACVNDRTVPLTTIHQP
jgi:GntR family transcriptional regulator of arabinose operon